MRRLGTVSEAVEELGLSDAAELWELVAEGRLRATHEELLRGELGVVAPTWTIWEPS